MCAYFIFISMWSFFVVIIEENCEIYFCVSMNFKNVSDKFFFRAK